MKRQIALFALAAVICAGAPALAQKTIGSVSTNFRMVGPNDKVVVERIEDPKVPNVSCYVAYAQTGGVSGGVDLAENPSQFALNCVGFGPVAIPADLPNKEQIAAISASFLFKHFILTRMVDQDKHALVYVMISTKVLSGSPANAVSAVPASTAAPASAAP